VSEKERINDLAAGDLGADGLADGPDDLVPHGAGPDDRQVAGNSMSGARSSRRAISRDAGFVRWVIMAPSCETIPVRQGGR
jgi:hypothetical protein